MDLIIFAHPDNKGSHNAAILKHVIQRLKTNFKKFEVIDLYEDGFDAILRLSPESQEKKELVKKYQKLIVESERLIFIFPVWWYNLPAILKGFVDIIFSPGFAHDFNPQDGSLRQKLKGKEAIVINTYGRSEKEFKTYNKEPSIIFDKAILEFCGVQVVSRINWFDVRLPCLLTTEVTREIDELI